MRKSILALSLILVGTSIIGCKKNSSYTEDNKDTLTITCKCPACKTY